MLRMQKIRAEVRLQQIRLLAARAENRDHGVSHDLWGPRRSRESLAAQRGAVVHIRRGARAVVGQQKAQRLS